MKYVLIGRFKLCLILVVKRILHPSLFETFFSEQATVALTAGVALVVWIIAGVGEGIVDAQFKALLDDLSFGHLDQRGMDFEF